MFSLQNVFDHVKAQAVTLQTLASKANEDTATEEQTKLETKSEDTLRSGGSSINAAVLQHGSSMFHLVNALWGGEGTDSIMNGNINNVAAGRYHAGKTTTLWSCLVYFFRY